MLKKILVFSFSFIGDAVLSTSVIQPLRRHFSDAHITFLVGPRAFDLLATDPNIDAALVYDNRGEHAGWKGRLRLIKTLRLEKFDLIVNLRDSLMARCIGAKHWGLLHGDGNRHAVTRYLEVLQRQGVDTTDASPLLELTEAEYCRCAPLSCRSRSDIRTIVNWYSSGWELGIQVVGCKELRECREYFSRKIRRSNFTLCRPERTGTPIEGCRNDGCPSNARQNGRSSASRGVNLCMRCVYRKRHGTDAYCCCREDPCSCAFRFNKPHSERSLR